MRHRLTSDDVSTWKAGRWGTRRVRVDECWAILTAETAYTQLLTEPEAMHIGSRGTVTYVLGGRVVTVRFEVCANAVWRHGRVFLRMQNGQALATLPLALAAPDASGRIQQLGQIPLASIPTGSYDLTLTITGGGVPIVRTAAFTVIEP